MRPNSSASAAEQGGLEAVTEDKAHSARERSAQDDDLRRSGAALTTLANNELDLEQLLTRVGEFAVQAIPGADGSGLTLMQEARPDTIVATAPFVREIDDIQYGLNQGPCVSAAAGGHTVMSGSLGRDQRWPHAKHAFDDRAAALGEAFAAPAAIAVQNAAVLAQALRLTKQLQAAQTTRSIIDRAVGMLMSRSGIPEQEALDRLRAISQHEHRKLADVAQQVVDQGVR